MVLTAYFIGLPGIIPILGGVLSKALSQAAIDPAEQK
jgi:hypothetical protein